MLKFFPCLVMALFVLVSCATTPSAISEVLESTPEGKVVEQAILWDGELDEGWNSVAMKELVSDSERFEAQGMSYLALEPIVVFGHRAAYVSYLGMESLAGPNAILKGTPKSIATIISKNHDAVFQVKNGVYICDYKPTVRILIQTHPELEGASIIIGAYSGPR